MSFNDIHNSIKLPECCQLGSFIKIYPGVTLGQNVRIGDFCVLGQPSQFSEKAQLGVHIPDHSIIRSHTVIYSGSEFGVRLETGHHVVIREGTTAGEDLRVGNYTDIEGSCRIGDFCRFHGYVHVGKGSQVGDFVWLFSLVTLTNDPLPPSHVQQGVVIGDGVVVCVGATLFPGSKIGLGTMIAAQAEVRGIIPPAIFFYNGNDAIPITKIRNLEHKLQLPWPNHYYDVYPEHAQQRLHLLKEAITKESNGTRSR